MKLIKIFLSFCLILCFITPVSAQTEQPNENNKGEEILYVDQNVENKGVLTKCVIFVIQAIASGIIYDGLKYAYNYINSYTVIQEYAIENNVGDYTIKSMREVYDDGCWKPEFPNNPFCSYSLKE